MEVSINEEFGGCEECVADLAAEAAQVVQESKKQKGKAPAPKIDNAGWTIDKVIDEIKTQTGDWPRSVMGTLFIDDPERGITFFKTKGVERLFGWLRSRFHLEWPNKKDRPTKGELFAELERVATRYSTVEVYPHEPPIVDAYYSGTIPEPGDGSTLKQLLDRFNPSTTADRQLIKSFIMTVIWGGPAGARPIYVVDSKDGRGAGKSKVVDIIGRIVGGHIEATTGMDFERFKTRLLTAEARHLRVCLLDNVKSHGLSCAELEALITASVISGHDLYVGEGSMPNLKTWAITTNGAALGKDLAQRSVYIMIDKPEYEGTWLEDTYKFVDENRDAIIGDAIAALRTNPKPLDIHTRWGAWEKAVLCRLDDPNEIQKLIIERRALADTEDEECDMVEEAIHDWLDELNYDADTAVVRIPNKYVFDKYKEATGESRLTHKGIGRKLPQMIDQGTIKRLRVDPSRTHGRGYIYTGEHAEKDAAIQHDIEERIATFKSDHNIRW